MSGHADTVRRALDERFRFRGADDDPTEFDTYAALDALETERDRIQHIAGRLLLRAEAAEAENAKMKKLLYDDDGLNGVVPQLDRAEANADKNAAALAKQIRKAVKAQEALQQVIDACDADCSLSHIEWLAKQGLRP